MKFFPHVAFSLITSLQCVVLSLWPRQKTAHTRPRDLFQYILLELKDLRLRAVDARAARFIRWPV